MNMNSSKRNEFIDKLETLLKESYEAIPKPWEPYANKVPVANYKTQTRIKLAGLGEKPVTVYSDEQCHYLDSIEEAGRAEYRVKDRNPDQVVDEPQDQDHALVSLIYINNRDWRSHMDPLLFYGQDIVNLANRAAIGIQKFIDDLFPGESIYDKPPQRLFELGFLGGVEYPTLWIQDDLVDGDVERDQMSLKCRFVYGGLRMDDEWWLAGNSPQTANKAR